MQIGLKNSSKVLSLAAMLFLTSLPTDVLSQGNLITGAVFIEASRDALADVSAQARRDGQMVLADAAFHANAMLDRLERDLAENIQKPIRELNQTLQNEISAVRATVDSVVETANQLPNCIGNEADIVLAALKSGLQSALTSLPLVHQQPIAYLIQQPITRAPYTILRDPDSTDELSLVLRGANLWTTESVCEDQITAKATSLDQGKNSLPIDVEAYDAEKIILGLDPAISDGEWVIEVTAGVPATVFGCLWSDKQSVSAPARVLTPISAQVSVHVTPACVGYEKCVRPFNGSCTNGSERRDTNCTHPYGFDEKECEFVEVQDWSKGGRQGFVVDPRRQGDTIVVVSTANRRPRFQGGTSRVFWSGTMIGRKKVDPVLQERFSIEIPDRIRAGNSVPFNVNWEKPEACEIDTWSLGASVTFSDGKTGSLPERTGPDKYSVSTVSPQGVFVSLNTLTNAGTVQFNRQGCLAR